MNAVKQIAESAEQPKKVYVKPQVMAIWLVAEEAVLGLCKQNNSIFEFLRARSSLRRFLGAQLDQNCYLWDININAGSL